LALDSGGAPLFLPIIALAQADKVCIIRPLSPTSKLTRKRFAGAFQEIQAAFQKLKNHPTDGLSTELISELHGSISRRAGIDCETKPHERDEIDVESSITNLVRRIGQQLPTFFKRCS
jgi:hypothetical protein